MRAPLEYGDNFPVPTGSWDPTIPWRFPHQQIRLRRPSVFSQILPWITLGIGVILGFCILWMGWGPTDPFHPLVSDPSHPVSLERTQGEKPNLSAPSRGANESPPKSQPIRVRSRLA